MYVVVHPFTDLHDNDYPYKEGDTFPRLGIEVTDKRLKELSGGGNKQGRPLIREVTDDKADAALASMRGAVDATKSKGPARDKR